MRYTCRPCGGFGICEHKRKWSTCAPCGGGGVCEHGKARSGCKLCGGSRLCEHGRQKNKCVPCGGPSICEHNRIRSACVECMPLEKRLRSRSFCNICGITRVNGSQRHTGICAGCATTPAEAMGPVHGELKRAATGDCVDVNSWHSIRCESCDYETLSTRVMTLHQTSSHPPKEHKCTRLWNSVDVCTLTFHTWYVRTLLSTSLNPELHFSLLTYFVFCISAGLNSKRIVRTTIRCGRAKSVW
jgi:hypothetical protein